MSLLKALVHPNWTSSHILVETYVHSSGDMADDYRHKFGEFFDDFSEKCCIRLAHISGRDLPIFSYCLMPSGNEFSVAAFKNLTKYSDGTYLLISVEIEDVGGESAIDKAIDLIAGHVGLVRTIWGPRTAWSLVQRSIVNVSTGDVRDPSPIIPVPNKHNKAWDDDIDKVKLIQALQEHAVGDGLWRSLRLASRGSDSNELDKVLWFWSAMEVLCGSEKEAEISKALAGVYGSTEDWKTTGEKFGIRHAARARHDIAHKGNFRNHGGEVTEYYVALYIDLLSGLYLGRCVKRAERMIENGFDVSLLYQRDGGPYVLDIDIDDGDATSDHVN